MNRLRHERYDTNMTVSCESHDGFAAMHARPAIRPFTAWLVLRSYADEARIDYRRPPTVCVCTNTVPVDRTGRAHCSETGRGHGEHATAQAQEAAHEEGEPRQAATGRQVGFVAPYEARSAGEDKRPLLLRFQR